MARVETHECRNCGAPLGIPKDHDRYFTCASCGSVLEDVSSPDQRMAGAVVIEIAHEMPVDVSTLRSYAGPVRTISRLVAAVAVLAGIGVLVGGGLAISDAIDSVSDVGGIGKVATSDGSRLQIYNYAAAATAASDDGSTDDVIAVARTSDGEQIVYADLDDDPVLRWAVPRELESEVFTQFVATDDLILLSADREVLALDRATGAEVWATELSDVVAPNVCTGCFATFGGGIVTLTSDGVLSSHSVATGEQLWSSRLTTTPRQVLPLGADPAVLDEVDGTVRLRVFSAADGSPVAALPVSCPDTTFGGRNEPSIYAPLHAGPDRSIVYIAEPSFGGCAQRWVAGSGDAPAWEVPYEFPHPTGPESADVVMDGTVAIVASGGVVDEIALATGAVRRVAELPDVDLSPIGVADGVVAVAAKSTRGSADWTIEGIDLASGAVRWTHVPESGPRMDDDMTFVTGDSWTASPTTAGLSVVQFLDDAESFVLTSIAMASGVPSPATTIDLSGRSVSLSVWVFGWRGDVVTTGVSGDLVMIDAATGAIVAEGP